MSRAIKILADRHRLALVGLIAVRPRTLDELSRELAELTPARLKRHLKLLEEEEWIEKEADGPYQLKLESLTNLRAALARVEVASPEPAEAAETVKQTYFDSEGRLKGLPTQRSRREWVLRQVTERCFTLGRIYEEEEVNALLSPLYDNYRALRRALVASGLLEYREGRYWMSLRKSLEWPAAPGDSAASHPS